VMAPVPLPPTTAPAASSASGPSSTANNQGVPRICSNCKDTTTQRWRRNKAQEWVCRIEQLNWVGLGWGASWRLRTLCITYLPSFNGRFLFFRRFVMLVASMSG
jgi:hypothetical protein